MISKNNHDGYLRYCYSRLRPVKRCFKILSAWYSGMTFFLMIISLRSPLNITSNETLITKLSYEVDVVAGREYAFQEEKIIVIERFQDNYLILEQCHEDGLIDFLHFHDLDGNHIARADLFALVHLTELPFPNHILLRVDEVINLFLIVNYLINVPVGWSGV